VNYAPAFFRDQYTIKFFVTRIAKTNDKFVGGSFQRALFRKRQRSPASRGTKNSDYCYIMSFPTLKTRFQHVLPDKRKFTLHKDQTKKFRKCALGKGYIGVFGHFTMVLKTPLSLKVIGFLPYFSISFGCWFSSTHSNSILPLIASLL
jgi:hypothetical protein